jgi:hypothetical protein
MSTVMTSSTGAKWRETDLGEAEASASSAPGRPPRF